MATLAAQKRGSNRRPHEGERLELPERNARSATVSVNALAQELRDDLLHPLSRPARKRARGAHVEGRPIEAVVALPRQPDHEGLIAAANVIHALAKPYEAKLLAAGLPKELLAEVLTVSAALKSAKDARAQDYINRAHAAAQGQAEVRNAGDLLRFTNALIRKRVRGNPALRKAWEQAKRMGWRISPAEAPVAGALEGEGLQTLSLEALSFVWRGGSTGDQGIAFKGAEFLNPSS